MAGRRRTEIALGERLALNRVGSFEWDLEEGTLELDAAGLAVFDLRPDEYDGRPESLLARVSPEEGARLGSAVMTAIHAGRSSYGAYFRVLRRDGEQQWTHLRGRVLKDEHGTPRCVAGVVRDAGADRAQLAMTSPVQLAGWQRMTTVLQDTADALSRAMTVEDVTAVLTGEGGLERFGADGLVLGLVEGEVLQLVAQAGESMSALAELKLHRIDESLPLAEAVITQRPRFVTSLRELADRFPRLGPYAKRLELDAAAFLPLVAQARSVGGLALFFRGREDFTAEDRDLCLGLAGIIAQSLQRAILFDGERDFATGLQSTMLPRHIPEFDGVEIAARYHAASSGREVGGDWWDVIPLPRRRIGIAVGDVEGHDTQAAAVMGQLRIALRAFAGEGHPPSTVVARASRFLAELDTERFATCTYAQVDPATGDVRVARAGHMEPILRATGGRVSTPPVRGGLPLGLATEFGDEEYPETRLDLLPGETFVLFTDGLVEQSGSDVVAGVKALTEAVRAGPVQATAMADHLSEPLRQARPNGDDVALLVLRRDLDPGTPLAPRIHQYLHPADPQGLAETRTALRRALQDWGFASIVDDVEVAAGELMVNALLHTEAGAVVTLEVLPGPARRVRLWVKDRSSVWPRRRTPGEAATSGRGLLMVDAYTDAWGVEPRGDGKAVWCEFTATEPPPDGEGEGDGEARPGTDRGDGTP
ncbi:SpoIIE family protein phosphatase [Streptomyces sp. NPDC058067]|uniref:SpoIIE family protein phosphatase n=1 Tax=Streptomyces sp. NPDC058067 TaxID=3346324 RepID=UPI0036E720EC